MRLVRTWLFSSNKIRCSIWRRNFLSGLDSVCVRYDTHTYVRLILSLVLVSCVCNWLKIDSSLGTRAYACVCWHVIGRMYFCAQRYWTSSSVGHEGNASAMCCQSSRVVDQMEYTLSYGFRSSIRNRSIERESIDELVRLHIGLDRFALMRIDDGNGKNDSSNRLCHSSSTEHRRTISRTSTVDERIIVARLKRTTNT
jgi:hypothetical protein